MDLAEACCRDGIVHGMLSCLQGAMLDKFTWVIDL